MVTGSEGEVVDLAAMRRAQSKDEVAASFENLPIRKLEGYERFTYQFEHPQFLKFYLRSVAGSLVWFFLATLSASHLVRRGRNAA